MKLVYTPKLPPYKHQQDALFASMHKEHFAILMEMGTGKTQVAISTIGVNAATGNIRGALVVAPKGVYMNWVRKEIPAHLDPSMKVRVVAWRGGKSRENKDEIAWLMGDHEGFPILVMNIEALSGTERAIDLCEEFLRKYPSIMVVDESTKIKNHKAKRTKTVLWLGQLAKMRRILSGMPVTKSPLDVFSQFEFLKPGLLGHTSWWAFRSRYAIIEMKYFGSRTVKVITGYQNEDDLQRRIAPHSFRVLKEDCLDLPPKVYETREVELTEEQERIYAGVRDDATAILEGGSHVTATEVIVQLGRMHQVLCDHVTDELGVVHDVPTNRIQALLDIVEETDEPIVVWCSFKRSVPKIVEALKPYGGVVHYYGGTSDEDRKDAVAKFENGEARFFVGTPHTGGWGITLVRGAVAVYYSNAYDLELRMQSEDRIHRIGQEAAKVTYIDLVSPGTLDEKIIKALRAKINIASAVVGDSYREWLI